MKWDREFEDWLVKARLVLGLVASATFVLAAIIGFLEGRPFWQLLLCLALSWFFIEHSRRTNRTSSNDTPTN
ncbi:hypothetical protein [Marivita sp.]|uniref:hypothetical protein n=1 Tax=Marivita sp. TaxID=2003365 RepID=UPI003F72C7A8